LLEQTELTSLHNQAVRHLQKDDADEVGCLGRSQGISSPANVFSSDVTFNIRVLAVSPRIVAFLPVPQTQVEVGVIVSVVVRQVSSVSAICFGSGVAIIGSVRVIDVLTVRLSAIVVESEVEQEARFEAIVVEPVKYV
jgi:hypothetical protein